MEYKYRSNVPKEISASELRRKSKIHSMFRRLSTKKCKISHLFLYQFHIEMIMSGIYWTKQNILLKLISLVSFQVFNMASREFEITYMACVIFLSVSVDPEGARGS